ncbi:MAG: response regulator [Desulfobacterales bacterium]|jgi:signal transduction histidine kinase
MNTPTILIVDDEEVNARLIKAILAPENYNLISALSGSEALSMLETNRPDLILLDVMMPEMDGFETCIRIKQNKNTKIIPVLMVTALSEKEHRLKALDCGADDFLSKPVDKAELKIRVKSLLRIKEYHNELIERYEEIEKKNFRLQELEEFKDGLLHMIVHDLKNPLFAISGNIELLLLDKKNFSETQISAADNCLSSCQNLNEMVQQLLDINKLENRKLQLKREMTDLVPLIDGILNQLQKRAEEKQISINFVNTNGISTISIDSHLIRRVISNLVDNGIRHTPKGGRIEVTSGLEKSKNNLCVSVRDTGIGLDPAYHQKIFHKFEQVNLKNQGVSIGTAGLGLAFCKLAVEAHGGEIWVESKGEGQGATFCFTIPYG